MNRQAIKRYQRLLRLVEQQHKAEGQYTVYRHGKPAYSKSRKVESWKSHAFFLFLMYAMLYLIICI